MKTKFTILVILITIYTILLVGCSSGGTATVSDSNGLSGATKLAIGTLKLDSTDQAVTSAQASELGTLWQGYQSLSNSDTTSQVELNALVKQIQGIMTSDQLQAIEAMDLTDQSVNEVMQSLGNNVSENVPISTPNASALSQAGPSGGAGGMPGGGGDSVMNAIGSGMTIASTPAATQPATSTQSTQVDGRLLFALIQMLETRSQPSG